jgi:hypothetical protein
MKSPTGTRTSTAWMTRTGWVLSGVRRYSTSVYTLSPYGTVDTLELAHRLISVEKRSRFVDLRSSAVINCAL